MSTVSASPACASPTRVCLHSFMRSSCFDSSHVGFPIANYETTWPHYSLHLPAQHTSY
jgi:hypothetical protein